jgi:hypothetical protein
MLRRDSILQAVARYFPELLPLKLSTTGHTSNLHFGNYLLQSAEGAQLGDPLGPLYFCLASKELLESMGSALILGYLDDFAMSGQAVYL